MPLPIVKLGVLAEARAPKRDVRFRRPLPFQPFTMFEPRKTEGY